ncbi:hypothetical protein ASG95_20440 [Phycicoccus sp. Soil803]|nr:hypothetical protein ASG95_20440 [Phycicoccus sp. Soil803]
MREVAVTEGDKGDAQLRIGVSVNTYGVNDLVTVVDQIGDGAADDLVAAYLDEYDVASELRPDGDRHESLVTARGSRPGLRAFLDDGGFGAFTTTSKTSTR